MKSLYTWGDEYMQSLIGKETLNLVSQADAAHTEDIIFD
jgi:hypothetical protein